MKKVFDRVVKVKFNGSDNMPKKSITLRLSYYNTLMKINKKRKGVL